MNPNKRDMSKLSKPTKRKAAKAKLKVVRERETEIAVVRDHKKGWHVMVGAKHKKIARSTAYLVCKLPNGAQIHFHIDEERNKVSVSKGQDLVEGRINPDGEIHVTPYASNVLYVS